jgi:hypothetical protein
MSTAQVTHDRTAAGIRQDEWEAFCTERGLTQSMPGGDTWYGAGQQIQVVRQGRRHVTFRTYQAGEQVPEVARLAAACWARFGGRLTASPEITSIISDAVQASEPPAARSPRRGIPADSAAGRVIGALSRQQGNQPD